MGGKESSTGVEMTIGGWAHRCGKVGGTCSAGSSCSTSRCEVCEDWDNGGALLEVEDLPLNDISALSSVSIQSESHDELRGIDSDPCDNATPDTRLELDCLGKNAGPLSMERFMSNHCSLIFDAALEPHTPCSGTGRGAKPRRSSASRSCSLRSLRGGRKPRSRSAASRFSRETKEFGRVGEW